MAVDDKANDLAIGLTSHKTAPDWPRALSTLTVRFHCLEKRPPHLNPDLTLGSKINEAMKSILLLL